MSWKCSFRRTLPFVAALLAVPAAAQFDVNPDHFVDQPSAAPLRAGTSREQISDQQLADERQRLENYQQQIQAQQAAVDEAREALTSPQGSADEAGESIALAVQEKMLESVKKRLAEKIQQAELHIAALEAKQNTVQATAARPQTVHGKRAVNATLIASSH